MAKHCPSCGGGLIWAGRSPLDRHEARCAACGERFTRRIGWSECLQIGALFFILAHVFSTLIFDLFNAFGLSEEGRREASALVTLGALVIACIAVPLLTRKGRRLVPASEMEPAQRCAGQMPMKVRCPCCNERVELCSQDMKKVSTRRSLPLRFHCPHCDAWSRLSWSPIAKAIPFFVILTPFAILPFVEGTEARVMAFVGPAFAVVILGSLIGPRLLASSKTPRSGCPACGYDLSPYKPGFCPECGGAADGATV